MRKRMTVIIGLFVFTISSLVLIAWLNRPEIHAVTLHDGTQVQFMGMSEGTNHWNPTTPFFIRALYRSPRLGSILIPFLPKSARSLPSMAIIPKPGGILWFYVAKKPLFGHLVARCLNKNGEDVGQPVNLGDRSGTNATAIWLQSLELSDLANIHSIEIYSREMPLSGRMNGVLDPISEMDINPGLRVGEFTIPKRTLRR